MSVIYNLPDELQRLIFKKTYDGVIQEIRQFLLLNQSYIFRKPNILNHADTFLFILSLSDGVFEFSSNEKYYNGNRQTYYLTFNYAFLHLKKHPTGVYDNGYKIEYVYYSDDESDDEIDDESDAASLSSLSSDESDDE